MYRRRIIGAERRCARLMDVSLGRAGSVTSPPRHVSAVPACQSGRTSLGAEDGLAVLGKGAFRTMEVRMLGWAITFFIVAIVAAVFGFGNIAAGASSIAQILFFIFLVLFIASLVTSLVRGRGRGRSV